MVFPPYNADELYDILAERSRLAFENGTAADGVLHLIAALAAQEHGDARRALDLLRVSAELAERQGEEHITEEHVQRAKNKIELDTVIEAVKSLPTQSKLILLGILLNEEIGNTKLTTGEVYTTYRDLSRKTGVTPLTQRRVTDLISELDMLGLVHARVRSFGRGGRVAPSAATRDRRLERQLEEAEPREFPSRAADDVPLDREPLPVVRSAGTGVERRCRARDERGVVVPHRDVPRPRGEEQE